MCENVDPSFAAPYLIVAYLSNISLEWWALIMFVFVCICWNHFPAPRQNGYFDVIWSYWTLHVSRQREASQLQAWVDYFGIPLTVSNPAESNRIWMVFGAFITYVAGKKVREKQNFLRPHDTPNAVAA